ncbi:hypothetical protein EYS14_15145 [Alteromonadaceae bacterium M269]|nr:hypothetical protein EYS14_15145 [Alteromonadaceae bacterium M269]
MSNIAVVNYHLHCDKQQAYHIDAGGEVGRLLSPELVPVQVDIRDAREEEINLSFSEDSVVFVSVASSANPTTNSEGWKCAYNDELDRVLKFELQAKEVIIFDHTIRIDDPNSNRKPARNVHSDYSRSGAQNRLIDLLGEEKASEWEKQHYAFVNVWRPVDNPILSAPLGFVRPRSVNPQDWLTIKLIYPDREGQIMGLVANEDHEWIYQSQMTPEEVAIFNIYDNQGQPSVAHSALDLVEDKAKNVIRKSLESRTLILY